MGIDVTAHAAVRTVALLAASGLGAISCGAPSTTTGTEPASTAAVVTTAAPTTVPQTTTAALTTTAVASSTTTTATRPSPPTPYWDVPDGIEVAVAADDGLHLLTGGDDRIISSDVFEDVAADPSGDGWFVEQPAAIHHISDDGTDRVVVTAEEGTWLQLHDVGTVDGHVTIFYNVDHPHNGALDDGSDEVYAMDVVTGTADKITEAGGWESGVVLNFGGGALVGLISAEAITMPWSVDLAGHEDVIDMQAVGLARTYEDVPASPKALTISADGGRLTWITWKMSEDGGNILGNQLTIAETDGSGSRELTLPAGPVGVGDIVDRGEYLVASSHQLGDRGSTPAALIDVETGGMLVLPVEGAAAARGRWVESPHWAIPSPVTEDVTEQIRALEPQWTGGQVTYEEALTNVLLGNDGGGECASTARTFPDYGPGDGPFYIELRQFCDDSNAGYWYDVVVLGPMPDGTVTGGATRRALCWRGVSPDGLCV